MSEPISPAPAASSSALAPVVYAAPALMIEYIDRVNISDHIRHVNVCREAV